MDAHAGGRFAHAWLLSGPKGIGKATFAYRAARFLLAGAGQGDLLGLPPENLHVDPDEPVARRIAAGGHGDLLVVERTSDPKSSSPAIRTRIVVDQIRAVGDFFAKTSAEGGWRIAIIDAAEDMNANAANALLKILEEPPAQSLLLLVSHAPGRLLATIHSRCRNLAFSPLNSSQVAQVLEGLPHDLSDDDLYAVAGLAEGSPGRAQALIDADGLAYYTTIVDLIGDAPALDYVRIHGLADQFTRRDGLDKFRVWSELFRLWVRRLVRSAAMPAEFAEAVAGEGALARRLTGTVPLDRWVGLWETANELSAQADGINLDRKQVVLGLFFELERMLQKA